MGVPNPLRRAGYGQIRRVGSGPSGAATQQLRPSMWIAILLLLLAGFYVAVERGQSTRDRILRWMVITGALILALLIGSGALR